LDWSSSQRVIDQESVPQAPVVNRKSWLPRERAPTATGHANHPKNSKLPPTQNATPASKINMRHSSLAAQRPQIIAFALSSKAQTLKKLDSMLLAFCDRLYCAFTIEPPRARLDVRSRKRAIRTGLAQGTRPDANSALAIDVVS
jgi:hypothetical protein